MRKTILWLSAVAVLTRATIALLQIRYGIDNQVNLDQFLYGPFNPGFELYHDFYGFYVTELTELSKGLIPYKDFGYSYPPLFLYTLYPFYQIGGVYSASIPILLSDALTAPLIYLIARRFANEKISLLAGVSYAISPFFLLYEGYLWYSSQPMTFFILLSLYLLLIERPILSSVTFALAVLFKQEVIFILPVYLIWYFKRFGVKTFYKGLISLAGILLVVSLPFLVLSPIDYISSLSYSTLEPSYIPLNDTSISNSVSTTTQQSLNCLAESSTWRSLVCNVGGFTYTDVKRIPPLNVILTGPFLNTISPLLAIGLFGAILYYVWLLRKRESVFLLGSALALMIFIAVFGLEVHSVYRYYIIPVYAIILASCKYRINVVLATTLPILSLFLPSGESELLPPLIALLLVIMITYSRSLTEHQVEPNSMERLTIID